MSTYIIKKVIDDVHGHYIAWERRIEKGNQKSVRDGQKRKKRLEMKNDFETGHVYYSMRKKMRSRQRKRRRKKMRR